ncbi:MAG: HTH-type transcriptional regulator RutR [Pseudomonas sp.]|nr:MAG: HTH-type transcriptional regulator RutR [Pseudomonas sp.]
MTAPHRLTDRKREAIVSAAIAEFRDNGFEVTSMDKIAATAGVSKRTVYNHFPSKEELFSEILHQMWANSVAQLDAAYDSNRPLREQLRILLQAKMRMMANPCFVDLARVAIAATIHSPERAQNMVSRLSKREEGFTQWVRSAQEDGRLSCTDPAFAAHQIQSLLKAFAFWPQVTLRQPPLDDASQAHAIESAIDLFLAGYEVVPKA